jgi:hypothetical protein
MGKAMRKGKRILEVMVTRSGNAYIDGLFVERDNLRLYRDVDCEFRILAYCHLVSSEEIEEIKKILGH